MLFRPGNVIKILKGKLPFDSVLLYGSCILDQSIPLINMYLLQKAILLILTRQYMIFILIRGIHFMKGPMGFNGFRPILVIITRTNFITMKGNLITCL